MGKKYDIKGHIDIVKKIEFTGAELIKFQHKKTKEIWGEIHGKFLVHYEKNPSIEGKINLESDGKWKPKESFAEHVSNIHLVGEKNGWYRYTCENENPGYTQFVIKSLWDKGIVCPLDSRNTKIGISLDFNYQKIKVNQDGVILDFMDSIFAIENNWVKQPSNSNS